MQNVTLKFRSAEQLWQFKQAIQVQEVQINLKDCTITCSCNEKGITLASEKYVASLVFGEDKSNIRSRQSFSR
jgi:hypothetical protein